MEINKESDERKNVVKWGQKEWEWTSVFAYILATVSSLMVNKSTDTGQWIVFSLIMFVGFIVAFRYIHLTAVLKNKKHSLFLLEFLMLAAIAVFNIEAAFANAGIIGEKYWQGYTLVAFLLLGITYVIIWTSNIKKE